MFLSTDSITSYQFDSLNAIAIVDNTDMLRNNLIAFFYIRNRCYSMLFKVNPVIPLINNNKKLFKLRQNIPVVFTNTFINLAIAKISIVYISF